MRIKFSAPESLIKAFEPFHKNGVIEEQNKWLLNVARNEQEFKEYINKRRAGWGLKYGEWAREILFCLKQNQILKVQPAGNLMHIVINYLLDKKPQNFKKIWEKLVILDNELSEKATQLGCSFNNSEVKFYAELYSTELNNLIN